MGVLRCALFVAAMGIYNKEFSLEFFQQI